ncbi:MAG: hypothetical protein ABW200_08310 [Hyphomicrobiaceae bacterium]|jgi:hypothetical protein
MDATVTTNWMTIVGLLYLGVALMLLAKPLALPLWDRTHETIAGRAAAQRADAVLALPFLAVGFVTLIAAQFHLAALGIPVVLLLISLCVALVLYVGLDGYFIEQGEPMQQRELPQRPQLAPGAEPERPALQIVQSKSS